MSLFVVAAGWLCLALGAPLVAVALFGLGFVLALLELLL